MFISETTPCTASNEPTTRAAAGVSMFCVRNKKVKMEDGAVVCEGIEGRED